jgi:hypothetical protein
VEFLPLVLLNISLSARGGSQLLLLQLLLLLLLNIPLLVLEVALRILSAGWARSGTGGRPMHLLQRVRCVRSKTSLTGLEADRRRH